MGVGTCVRFEKSKEAEHMEKQALEYLLGQGISVEQIIEKILTLVPRGKGEKLL